MAKYNYKQGAEEITARVIKAIEENGSLPWVKPWKGGNPLMGGAVSYSTGRPYSLLNQFLLGGAGEWLTFNACKKLGGSIKKGEKARTIFFTTMITKEVEEIDENGKKEKRNECYPIFESYSVFEVSQCEGIARKWEQQETEAREVTELDANAEAVIAAYIDREGITFKNNVNSSRAYYAPSKDEVVVPNAEQFAALNEYYSTTFHELTHSTLKASRCNRPQDENGLEACFGNAPYAKEELVAEIGAALCLARLGMSNETTERNSAAYLNSWLSALKKDTKMLISAAGKAEKAAAYIFNE